nr:MAG TPA: ribonuclease [Caudoviricetes sp.]
MLEHRTGQRKDFCSVFPSFYQKKPVDARRK